MSGLLVGCCIPLVYELAAELTYPAPESTSSNVIVLLLNLASLVFLFVTPGLLHLHALNLVRACATLAWLAGCRVAWSWL